VWLFTGQKLGEETIGDPVCYDTVPRQLGARHFTGKALDNRVGCALLLALARALRDGALVAPGCRIDIGFTVQEEIGAHGAELLVKRLQPTIAVVVDTVTATDGVFSDRTSSNVRLGHGPVLRRFDVVDFSRHLPAGGAVYSRRLADLAYGCARDAGLPVQRDVAATWTDAAKVCGAGAGGVLSLGLFVPRWGSHSPVEVVDLRDVQAAEQLIIALIRKLSVDPAGFAAPPW
jgi:endoglucanase